MKIPLSMVMITSLKTNTEIILLLMLDTQTIHNHFVQWSSVSTLYLETYLDKALANVHNT